MRPKCTRTLVLLSGHVTIVSGRTLLVWTFGRTVESCSSQCGVAKSGRVECLSKCSWNIGRETHVRTSFCQSKPRSVNGTLSQRVEGETRGRTAALATGTHRSCTGGFSLITSRNWPMLPLNTGADLMEPGTLPRSSDSQRRSPAGGAKHHDQ